MSRSIVYDKPIGKVKQAKSSNYPTSKASTVSFSSVITESKNKIQLIETSDYDTVLVNEKVKHSYIKDILSFRVRFTSLGIESYGSNNPPPIGIAVIGFNNYII